MPWMIRAVLFDLDGTLFDRDTGVRALVADQYDAEPGLAGVERGEWLERFIALDARGYVKKQEVYAKLLQEFGAPGVTAQALYADYWARYDRYVTPFAGMRETLERLKSNGHRLGIITNGATTVQRAKIRALGVEPLFDAVLVSEAEGVRKPDPEIFLRAVERLGVRPEEAAYVGDHPVNDVQGAQGAGLRAVWKRDDFFGPPARPDAVIEGLPEIPALIQAWQGERV